MRAHYYVSKLLPLAGFSVAVMSSSIAQATWSWSSWMPSYGTNYGTDSTSSSTAYATSSASSTTSGSYASASAYASGNASAYAYAEASSSSSSYEPEPKPEKVDTIAYDGAIGGRLWIDRDGDGLQSDDVDYERGLFKGPVELYDDNGEMLSITYSAGTTGDYEFTSLAVSDSGIPYRVKFASPSTCRFSPANVYDNTKDTKDSDSDETTGYSHWVYLTHYASTDYSLDSGIVCDDAGSSKPLTKANDDLITGEKGKALVVDILANDYQSSDLKGVNIIEYPAELGSVEFIDGKLVISNDKGAYAGEYHITYELLCTDGTYGTAKVVVIIKEPEIVTPTGTIAEDDSVMGYVGDKLIVKILENDTLSHELKDVQIIENNVPGSVFINSYNNLTIKGTTKSGVYYVKYKLLSTSGSKDTATVKVVLKEKPVDPSPKPNKPWACEVQTGNGHNAGVEVHEKDKSHFSSSYQFFDYHKRPIKKVYRNNTSEEGWSYKYDSKGRKVWWYEVEWEGIEFNYQEYKVYYVAKIKDGVKSDLLYCKRRNISPIAIDLDNNGKVERIKGQFEFDLTGNGQQERVGEWFGPHEGILVDNRIVETLSGQYLFGDMGGAYVDGFAKLATRDLNQDGAVEAAELDGLGLWIDANSNALVDAGELHGLAEYNITALSVSHKRFVSAATLNNGQTLMMEDVWFPLVPVAGMVESVGTIAEGGAKLENSAGFVAALLSVIAGILGGVMIFNRSKSQPKDVAA